MKKLSESVWSDIHKRSIGQEVRKEDKGKEIIIDGQKYFLMKSFWELGDQYNEENNNEWTFFAFNEPKDGDNRIYDGIFCEYTYELPLNKTYDTYVLKYYLTRSKEDMVNEILENGNIQKIKKSHYEIKDIIIKYVNKLFDENHMSNLAIYHTHCLVKSEWNWNNKLGAIFFYDGNDICEEDLEREFPDETIISTHTIAFANIPGWSEHFKKEITNTYKKLGWTLSDADPVDPYNGWPIATLGIVFVKFK